MADRVADILEYAVLGLFLLWAAGYATRIIPRLCAGRVAITEGEWTRDTVEYDRLSVILSMLPGIAGVVPCLVRLCLGVTETYTLPLLAGCLIFMSAVTVQTGGAQLRYDTDGLVFRLTVGKEYRVSLDRVVAVEWLSKGKKGRSRTPLVAIRCKSELLGRSFDDVYYLDPTRMRGIRRFLAFWAEWQNHAESAEKEKDTALSMENKPQVD